MNDLVKMKKGNKNINTIVRMLKPALTKTSNIKLAFGKKEKQKKKR